MLSKQPAQSAHMEHRWAECSGTDQGLGDAFSFKRGQRAAACIFLQEGIIGSLPMIISRRDFNVLYHIPVPVPIRKKDDKHISLILTSVPVNHGVPSLVNQ